MTERINIRSFGAKGNFDHDDGPFIQDALNALNPDFGGQIYVPPGLYRSSIPLHARARNTIIVGAGPEASQIMPSHLNGSGIRFWATAPGLRDLSIIAVEDRFHNPNFTNDFPSPIHHGVLFEPIDATFIEPISWSHMQNVRVFAHPGHGVCFSWRWGLAVAHVESNNNAGHGMVVDAGHITGREHIGQVSCHIDRLKASFNGGHGFAMGHPNTLHSRMIRPFFYKLDMTNNAYRSDVRFTEHQMWAKGNGIRIDDFAAKCRSDAGGIWLQAVNAWVTNTRFIMVQGNEVHCVYLSDDSPTHTSRNVFVEINDLFGGTLFGATPMVRAESGVRDVTVIRRMPLAGGSQVLTPGVPGSVVMLGSNTEANIHQSHPGIWEQRGKVVTPLVEADLAMARNVRARDGFSIANNAVQTLNVGTARYGVMVLAGATQGSQQALIGFGTGIGAGNRFTSLIAGTPDVEVVSAGGFLTGTTGNSGKVTVSAHDNGLIYIENRTGFARTFGVAFLGGTGALIV